MPSPITVAGFIPRTIMPQDDVIALESSEPGFLQKALDGRWDWITSRLRKRYDVAAMQANPPEITLRWLTDLTTLKAYQKRGFNPASESDRSAIIEPAAEAEAEVKEAANSQEGLFDLPLLASSTASGISQGGPLGYSERSPYVWTTRQRDDARAEDATGRGKGQTL